MTGFFHIPSAFGVLEERVIPALFENKSTKDPIRVWVAGCATGEEAYSVAILLFQYASTLKAPPKIEIFATDNDKHALDYAKKGVYTPGIQGQMSQYCLSRYFMQDGEGYAVVPEVRGAILFSSHDVLIDNSFQSFDLITCRNLLGYLDHASQTQIVTFFHHSLRPGGHLFLGDAEFAESLPGQFVPIDKRFKIFRLSPEDDTARSDEYEDADGDTVTDGSNVVDQSIAHELTEPLMPNGVVNGDDTLPDVDFPPVYHDANDPIAIDTPYMVDADNGKNGVFAPQATLSVTTPVLEMPEQEKRANHSETHNEPLLSVSLLQEVLVKQYAPPSLLVDSAYEIIEHTEHLARVFEVTETNLIEVYLNKLPDYDRLRIEEAIKQVILDQKVEKPIKIESLVDGEIGNYSSILVKYVQDPGGGEGYAQLVFQEKEVEGGTSQVQSNVSLFDTNNIANANGQQDKREPDRKAAELEEAYLGVFSGAPFPILVHAEGGKIIVSSPAWHQMAGVEEAEVETISDWIKRVRGQRLSLKDSSLKVAYEEKGVVCISIHTTYGDTKLLAFHSYFLGKDSQNRKLTLTMAVDITNYPGHMGVGITPEVADFGLAAKKAFLANMSHEVRTPLTSMIGFADYLVDKMTGQDVQFARYISESGNRLLETLNTVLRIASSDNIKQTIKYELVDVTQEVQGIIEFFKPQAEQYGLPLKMIVEHPARGLMDRPALRRIIINLVGNALKYTLDGDVNVVVGGDANTVIVSVEDTGMGISEEFLPFVFDRFTQESKGQSRSNSGCGLGLAIARQYVEMMGGAIHVESQQGAGSQFTIQLPTRIEELREHEGGHGAEEHEEEVQAKPRILVVEDNVDTQELLLLILQDKYHVTVTSNVTETLQVAKKQNFDAVLMDLNLGGRRTGFELIVEMRKMAPYEDTPILAVSALPIGVIRKQLIREGFNGYIAKPFTRARIHDALAGLLRGIES